MSKRNRKENQQAPQTPQAASPEKYAGFQPEVAAQNTEPRPQDASSKYLIVFWGMILLAVASAWILAILLPNVSESIIERWIMAALATALAVSLIVFK